MNQQAAPTPATDSVTDISRVLSAGLAMDAVTLRVGNLELMSSYYSNALALNPIEEAVVGREVHRVLGRGNTPLVKLIHTPELPAVDPRDAGLFHTAFLFDTQASLAATVYRAAGDEHGRFAGSSDHLVSEAFYFTDPEGNGIELYWDRPRGEWRFDGGNLQMASLPLDPNKYLSEHLGVHIADDTVPALLAAASTVGHVHLQVGDVPTARAFYVDALGFEATVANYPGALFASAGGYHHHVAMNTWNSRGAGPRAARLGLGDVAISVPGREDLDALTVRLVARGIQFADTGNTVVTNDPWGTQVTTAIVGRSAKDLLVSA